MDGGDDWDLSAVVRSCRSKAKASAAADPFSSSLFSDFTKREEESFPSFSTDFLFPRTRFEGLEELYKAQLSSHSSAAMGPTVSLPKKPQKPPAKRRKKQVRKVVCQVPADGVSSDMWAWRKYGQKPIKGSPFPRGYYRCSSFRGCPARKQVELNRADPGQLIITYTGEHNHPLPARHKFPFAASSSAPDSAAGNKEGDQLAASPATSASVGGDEEEKEEGEGEGEGEGELMVEDMEMIGEDELVFVGDGSAETTVTGESSSLFEDDDRLFSSPWLEKSSNGSATAAAC